MTSATSIRRNDPLGGDRRTDLLDAALSCFTEHGYASTTIEAIRVRADASIGSLYHHFDGKEALASALYLDRLTDYQSGYLEVLEGTSGAAAGVRGVVAHHLRWAVDRPDDARFLLGHSHLEMLLARTGELPEANRRFYAEVQAWLDPHVAAGLIRRLTADLYHALWLGPSQELTRQWLAGRARTNPSAAQDTLADAAWSALRSPKELLG